MRHHSSHWSLHWRHYGVALLALLLVLAGLYRYWLAGGPSRPTAVVPAGTQPTIAATDSP